MSIAVNTTKAMSRHKRAIRMQWMICFFEYFFIFSPVTAHYPRYAKNPRSPAVRSEIAEIGIGSSMSSVRSPVSVP